MCNYGSVPPILSPIARVPGQAPTFHVAPQTSQASVLLLILKLSCGDSPTLAQSHVGCCVPILFPAKRTPLLSRHQSWGSEKPLCWGPVWRIEALPSKTWFYVPAWEGGAEVLDIK